MLRLRIEHPSIGAPKWAEKQLTCPQCGHVMICFITPPTICYKCKEDLPPYDKITDEAKGRIRYHRANLFEKYNDKDKVKKNK